MHTIGLLEDRSRLFAGQQLCQRNLEPLESAGFNLEQIPLSQAFLLVWRLKLEAGTPASRLPVTQTPVVSAIRANEAEIQFIGDLSRSLLGRKCITDKGD